MGAPAAPSRPAAGEKEPKIEDQEPINEKKDKVMLEKGRFVWPVEGTVKTRFGIQPNKTYHNWIKIACPAGTRVMAAARGTVIFSANLKDFGETIIIRHDHDFATVYTHLKKRYVRADQAIKKARPSPRSEDWTKQETLILILKSALRAKPEIRYSICLDGTPINPLAASCRGMK
jgi:lipoprotein NlpD